MGLSFFQFVTEKLLVYFLGWLKMGFLSNFYDKKFPFSFDKVFLCQTEVRFYKSSNSLEVDLGIVQGNFFYAMNVKSIELEIEINGKRLLKSRVSKPFTVSPGDLTKENVVFDLTDFQGREIKKNKIDFCKVRASIYFSHHRKEENTAFTESPCLFYLVG